MIYFTADPHFFHSNIINLTNRPFKDMDDMHRVLIENWNSRINNNDEVYIIGDFLHKGSGTQANEILQKLKGRKYLIRGNHDTYLEDENFDPTAFKWIKDYHVLSYQKLKFVLFHYPILEWQGYFGNAIHVYGHVHNSSKENSQFERLRVLGPRAYNVGVDVNGFCPVSIESIIKKCSQ